LVIAGALAGGAIAWRSGRSDMSPRRAARYAFVLIKPGAPPVNGQIEVVLNWTEELKRRVPAP
jgi:hypothetical protein